MICDAAYAKLLTDTNSRGWKWLDFGGCVMLNSYVFALYLAPYDGTGEGGIRTLGSLFGYGALAKR